MQPQLPLSEPQYLKLFDLWVVMYQSVLKHILMYANYLASIS